MALLPLLATTGPRADIANRSWHSFQLSLHSRQPQPINPNWHASWNLCAVLAWGILSLVWLRECRTVATALGETKSLNRSWQWHLKKRRLRRRIAFQIFGFQTYLFATPSLLTICITSVLDWDSNKVYDLLALKNISLGTSRQRCQWKTPWSHKGTLPPLPEGVRVFRTSHCGQIPLPDLK